MACTDQEYFVGNGDVLIRPVADDCGDPTGGWFKLGDADTLSISNSQDFGDHFESQSGNRVRSARWRNSTTVDFTLAVQNISIDNLVVLLQGVDSGAVAAGSVVSEEVKFAYEGKWVYTAYPGITSVSVSNGNGSPATALTLNTDYTIDSRNGGIYIVSGSPNFVGDGSSLYVSYTHVGIEGAVEALAAGVQDWQIRFNGINLNATNKPVIVTLKRAQINATEELSLIGQDITSLSFTGAVLPDTNNEFYEVVKSNAVA